MAKKKKETITCPYCNAILEVDFYGQGKCPECGGKLIVRRDDAIEVNITTKWWSGTLWLSFSE
jgi:predicted RNA-binding Zn-ribbon protein involved in translation (DUF1610 family)